MINSLPFKDWLELRGYAKSTIRQYLLFANIAPPNTQEGINTFLQKHNGSLPKAFLKLYFHEYLWERQLDIPRQRGRHKQRIPIHVSKDEYEALKNNPDIPPRLKLIIRIAWTTALRASELLAITPSRINQQENSIRGIGKGNKEFLVSIPPQLTTDLIEYITKNNTPKDKKIFKIGYHRANIIIADHTQRVLGKRYTLHKFRHGIATHLFSKGIKLPALQAFLRHSNPSTTLIYAHDIPEESKVLIRKEMEGE